MSSDHVMVVTTTATREEAIELGDMLVEERLAACVQTDGPLRSRYRWKGSICTEAEWRCTLKTSHALLPLLRNRLLEEHPYETPEFTVIEISDMSAEYRSWIESVLTPEEGCQFEDN